MLLNVAPVLLLPQHVSANLSDANALVQVVGRAAAVVARVLTGKDRPDYEPTADMGDVVVMINADKAVLTGKKNEEKIFYSHSGKPGNLKKQTPEELKAKFGGADVVWRAVSGMLPKNRLRDVRRSTPPFYCFSAVFLRSSVG